MQFKVFYTDYVEEKSVESQKPIKETIDQILHSMQCVLHTPKNFFGIFNDADETLQFMVNDDESIHVDIPVPAEQGSYAKTATLDECLDLVRGLGKDIRREQIAGLTFQKW